MAGSQFRLPRRRTKTRSARWVQVAEWLMDEIRRRRYHEARAAGFTIAEAQLLADSDIDVAKLRELVKRDCPPELRARILL